MIRTFGSEEYGMHKLELRLHNWMAVLGMAGELDNVDTGSLPSSTSRARAPAWPG